MKCGLRVVIIIIGFDMNRDFASSTSESQARIRTYRKWMPNILCDFHEMGTNATYFFQPGEPSRTNSH
jgi:hypothetical protein